MAACCARAAEGDAGVMGLLSGSESPNLWATRMQAKKKKAATSTIPIIFWVGGDPIGLELVGSMNRPEGNLTGLTTLNHGLVAKRVELLHEVAQGTSSIAVLINPTSPTLSKITIEEAQTAARGLGLELHILKASTERDLDGVFTRDFGPIASGAGSC